MLRQFRDNEGAIHFIQPDQEPNPDWVEMEVPTHPDPSYSVTLAITASSQNSTSGNYY